MRRFTALTTCVLAVIALVLGAVLTAVAQPAQEAAPLREVLVNPNELEGFADGFFPAQMDRLPIPGVVITVVQDDKVLLSKGYGFADLEHQTPMNPEETAVRIGSISKLFVATAVMQLAEQGKLDLHTDINDYLRSFKLADSFPQPVTLANLLTHTGGLGDYYYTSTDPARIPPLGDYLARHMPPRVMPPGEVMSYSSHGLSLAAYVVEEVSGTPFEQYVVQHILEPLGMLRSGYVLPSFMPKGLAVGYSYQNGTYVPQPVDYDGDWPAGALASTASEMARFMIAHLNSGCCQSACILQPATVEEMHRRQFAHHPELKGQTYGFLEGLQNGQRLLGHSGAIRGFGSILDLVPQRGLGYFMSFNAECAGTSACEIISAFPNQFLDRFFPAEPAAQPSQLPPTDADRAIGTYRLNRYEYHTINKVGILQSDVQVTASDIGIRVGSAQYVQIGPLLFQQVGGAERVAFRTNPNGSVTHMLREWLAYDKLAWYETGRFHKSLFDGFGWLWGLAACVWPTAWLRRRWRRLPRLPSVLRWGGWLLTLTSALNAVFLNSLVRLFWISRTTEAALLLLPLAAAGLTCGMLLVAGWMWWHRVGSAAVRMGYTLIELVAAGFVWFLHIWNFLGFRFG
jgi:CubicO group peptidase (beta-lactamase class C family)